MYCVFVLLCTLVKPEDRPCVYVLLCPGIYPPYPVCSSHQVTSMGMCIVHIYIYTYILSVML